MNPTLTFLTALLLAPLATLHAADVPVQKPNTLFIAADDLRRNSVAMGWSKQRPRTLTGWRHGVWSFTEETDTTMAGWLAKALPPGTIN